MNTNFLNLHIHTKATPFPPTFFERLDSILALYKTIGLEQIASASLLDRYDSKYILPETQSLQILEKLSDSYQILEVQGKVLQSYTTLYFDTASYELYKQQVNERANQYKVRIRKYEETGAVFLETKVKDHRDHTVKERCPIDKLVTSFDSISQSWIQARIPDDCWPLKPVMRNGYKRVILVNLPEQERVTLDFNMIFLGSQQVVRTEGVVVAEVKQLDPHKPSKAIEVFKQNRLRRGGFSKYCTGVALLNEQLKQNSLKPKMRMMQKLASEA